MKLIVLLCTCLLSVPSWAHGPTPQKVAESVEINAPIDKVWALVKNFSAISQWHPGISKSEGDGNNRSGDKRTLTLTNGEQLIEELDAYDEANHEYNYRLKQDNVKAIPASSYSGIVKLTGTGSSTKVEWKSRLYRGDTGNFPPDELNDEAAVNAMQAFFKAGLEGLKKKAESDG